MRKARLLFGTGLVLCTIPAAAMASGGEASGPNWLEIGVGVVNFIIFLFLLVRFGKAPVQDFLGNRSKTYRVALEEAREREEKAACIHKEYADKLSNMEAEVANILKNAQVDAERRKGQIIEQAHAMAEKMKNDAKLTIENEVSRVQEEIRLSLAEMIEKKAKTLLLEKMTDDDQKRLNDEFLKKLEEAS